MSASPCEILAPAGSPEALEAALSAGADAVYFGLKRLNARRGATNIDPAELPQTVAKIHQAGARAYLTLNVQLTQRELGLAFRTLKCAEEAQVDAVLVTDAALLAAIPHFPRLEFHFSTQAGISSSAGAGAAKQLGVTRVVVARELSREEIAACVNHEGQVEIEAFVQGAHCFSCSGRCLLSSWGGGRSGNRGACTSPCRVMWKNQHGEAGNPLSMHDMSLLADVRELQELGVASLKIEGRLKSPAWVRETVSLYRQALDGAPSQPLLERAAKLGDYSGRQQSDGFYRGQRQHLTGSSARPAANAIPNDEPNESADKPELGATMTLDDSGATIVTLTYGQAGDSLRLARQRIANPSRALTWSEAAMALADGLPKGQHFDRVCFEPPELAEQLVPKHFRKHLANFAGDFCRQCAKQTDGVVRSAQGLPEAIASWLQPRTQPHPANCLTLGKPVTHLRLDAEQARTLTAEQLAAAELEHCWLILELAPQTTSEAERLARIVLARADLLDAIALPDIVYEAQLPVLRHLLQLVARVVPAIEVNSWDTWELARTCGRPLWAGPGLAVLNSVAASQLATLGCQRVAVSPEIDQEQLQDLCAAATVPLALTVFSHVRLMATRAILPEGFSPDDQAQLEDARHTVLVPHVEGAVTALRAQVPLDWRRLHNRSVQVAMLVLDAVGCEQLPTREASGSLFNYDRRLR